jgi:predicted proteasome-type protease
MSTPVFGQSIEFIYLPTEASKVVQFKSSLTGKIGATNALSLMNITDKRKNAYLDKISSSAAVVVFGDGALKAVSKIDFPMPLFIINGDGETAAKNSVVVLLDKSFDGRVDNATQITNLNDIPQLYGVERVVLFCHGQKIRDVLSTMLSNLR